MNDYTDIVNKSLDKIFKNIEKDNKERVEPSIEKAKQSIKHPHFYYALIDTEKLTIEYKRKKWYKWFSGKRIVCVKLSTLRSQNGKELEL